MADVADILYDAFLERVVYQAQNPTHLLFPLTVTLQTCFIYTHCHGKWHHIHPVIQTINMLPFVNPPFLLFSIKSRTAISPDSFSLVSFLILC